VAVTPDGHFVVSASRDQTLRLWDLKSRKTIRKFKGHADAVFAVAVTPDGRCAISGSKDRTLRLWDLKSGKTIRKFEGHTDEVYAVAVTSDGRFVVSGSEDHTLRLWNIKRKKAIAIFTGESAMRSCAIARNGRTIIAGDDTGRVYFVSVVEPDNTMRLGRAIKIPLLQR
jgi:WD40 repeat protein